MTSDMCSPIIELRGISRQFARRFSMTEWAFALGGLARKPQTLHALEGIDLALDEGQVVGLVGESGSGKSTLGRIVARTLVQSGGEMLYRGTPISAMSSEERKRVDRKIQMIFQNPMGALNPRMRVGVQISEAPLVHGLWRKRETSDRLDALMTMVGLSPIYQQRFPHQLSGGERQRVVIARALAVEPDVLVCDESTAALDVAIQAQILNLFSGLRSRLGLTYLFISHDLGTVRYLADRVAVMYLGRIVESAPANQFFANPRHPYSHALIDGAMRLGDRSRRFQPIRGEVPSPYYRPSGCHFHPRCPQAMERCRVQEPALIEVGTGQRAACHLNEGKNGNAGANEHRSKISPDPVARA